jgi:shikimate dehydrogenase
LMRPLLGLSPRKVVICNRSQPKSLCIAEYFKPWGKVRTINYEQLKRGKFDVIINATSAGLMGELPPLPETFNAHNAECYDLCYHEAHKPFLRWARKNGARKVIDGLGMLVEQAAEAFYLWHNVRPNTGDAINRIKDRELP